MSTSQADIAMGIALEKKSRQAAELAMQGKWSVAVKLNKEIVCHYPDNVDAFNRLGKSLLEMGLVKEAIESFQDAVKLSPNNPIATKNLQNLRTIDSSNNYKNYKKKSAAWPQSANEEYGKVAVVELVNKTNNKVLDALVNGEEIEFAIIDKIIKAISSNGTRLGQVEPKLGARISKLIKAGNIYKAFIKKRGGNSVNLLIREVYQHPSQIGVVSFPNIGSANSFDNHLYEKLQITQHLNGNYDFYLNDEWDEDNPQNGADQELYPQVDKIINAPNQLIADY